jgi:hypothetical protein
VKHYFLACVTHITATSPTYLINTQTIHINNSMPSSHQPSGSWSKKQEDRLKDLICSNSVNYKNQTPEYLYKITEQYFPNFISPGAQGRNSTIQCMQNKFIKYKQDILLRGARGAQGKYVLACSLLCNMGNTQFCSFLSQFIFLSQEPAATTAGIEDAVEEEAEETTPAQQELGSPNLGMVTVAWRCLKN